MVRGGPTVFEHSCFFVSQNSNRGRHLLHSGNALERDPCGQFGTCATPHGCPETGPKFATKKKRLGSGGWNRKNIGWPIESGFRLLAQGVRAINKRFWARARTVASHLSRLKTTPAKVLVVIKKTCKTDKSCSRGGGALLLGTARHRRTICGGPTRLRIQQQGDLFDTFCVTEIRRKEGPIRSCEKQQGKKACNVF